jgi:cytochrome P450
MTDLRQTYGKVATLARGGSQPLFFGTEAKKPGTYFIFSSELNRSVLTDLEVFETRAPPGPPTRAYERLSSNLLFINGERHKQQRQLLMPAFKRTSLQYYFHEIVKYTSAMIDQWQHQGRVELVGEMNRVALNIGSKTLYGQDASSDNHNLAGSINEMLGLLLSPVSMFRLDFPGSPYRRLKRRMDEIIEALEQEIERKRSEGAGGSDVLSMIVRAHSEDPSLLTDDELIGESFVVFFAGHDTTSKALTWTLFLLAQHPQCMADILDELDSVLGDEPPTYEQIYGLTALDQAVKECLRLLPPAVMFPRVAVQDTQLGPFEIPAESEVIYSPYITHRDPDCYSEPRKFLPERWATATPSSYEYLPFGGGFRTCLGVSFASMQIRLMVALILRRCQLQVEPGTRIDLKTTAVMAPKGKIPILVRRQDRNFAKGPTEVGGYIREMVDFGG